MPSFHWTVLDARLAGQRAELSEQALREGLVLGRDHPLGALRWGEDAAGLSRWHAQLWLDTSGRVWVKDLNSRFGTEVDGEAVKAPRVLSAGSVLSLGPHLRLRFEGPSLEAPDPVPPPRAASPRAVAHAPYAAPIAEATPAPRASRPVAVRPPLSVRRDQRVWLGGAALAVIGLLSLVGASLWLTADERTEADAVGRVGAEDAIVELPPGADPPEDELRPGEPERAPPDAAPVDDPSADDPPPEALPVELAEPAPSLDPVEQAELDTLLLEDHILELLQTLSGREDIAFSDRLFVKRVEEVMPQFVRKNTAYWRGYCRWKSLGPSITDLMEREMRELGSPAGRGRAMSALAWVESALVSNATSTAGAMGPWQFMKATWRRYEDEGEAADTRCDLYVATTRAATYLHDIFEQCGDEYPFLAIAGYNAGENRTCKLSKRADVPRGRSNTWPFTSYDVLPDETRDYVPKFVAASFALAHPESAARIGARRMAPGTSVGWAEPDVCQPHRVRMPELRACGG